MRFIIPTACKWCLSLKSVFSGVLLLIHVCSSPKVSSLFKNHSEFSGPTASTTWCFVHPPAHFRMGLVPLQQFSYSFNAQYQTAATGHNVNCRLNWKELTKPFLTALVQTEPCLGTPISWAILFNATPIQKVTSLLKLHQTRLSTLQGTERSISLKKKLN